MVLIYKEGDMYWAEVKQLPGCYTQGATLREVLSNVAEAIELYLSATGDPRDSPA